MIPGIVSAPLFASAQGMSAVATPSAVSKVKSTYGGSPQLLTTPETTVTVTGGTPPYTHSWAGDGGASAVSPSAATTAFHETMDPGEIDSSTFTDTVTDANGIVTTAECDVYIQLVDIR